MIIRKKSTKLGPTLGKHFQNYRVIIDEEMKEKSEKLRPRSFNIAKQWDNIFQVIKALSKLAVASQQSYTVKQQFSLGLKLI